MKNVKAIIFTAMAAATLGLTAPQAAKAGGIYWNNNGGSAVIINRNGRFYGPRGNNYGPAYYGGRRFVQGPPVLVHVATTVVLFASATDDPLILSLASE